MQIYPQHVTADTEIFCIKALFLINFRELRTYFNVTCAGNQVPAKSGIPGRAWEYREEPCS
jgi:hypothetical protein